MEQKQMDESDRGRPSTLWRLARIGALSGVLCFLTLALAHYVSSELNDANGLDLTNPLAIAFFVLALGCAWLLVRQIRMPAGEAPLTRQERLNRNFHIASAVAAIVLAIAMLPGFTDDSGGGLLSNDPLPPTDVILPILVFGVLGPAISFYWHRIIDEQEADAYKSGALVAFYVFASGAPVWWLAWRGGFVPRPDGIIIWLVTISIASGIWLWKKYR